MHCHVRNDDGSVSSDPMKFKNLKDGITKFCPGMIIQFSTGGRSGIGKERGHMLSSSPDMASLTVGSNNFPNRVYENSPELINFPEKKIKPAIIRPVKASIIGVALNMMAVTLIFLFTKSVITLSAFFFSRSSF